MAYHSIAAPSHDFAVGQDADGALWLVFLEDKTLRTERLTDQPVTFREFMPDGALVVQFEGCNAYEVLHPYS